MICGNLIIMFPEITKEEFHFWEKERTDAETHVSQLIMSTPKLYSQRQFISGL